MKVADIMTQDVIAVAATTLIRDAARLMVQHGVSGLPVVNEEGVPIGIITEGDLILRQRSPSSRRRSWWTLFFSDAEHLAREYQRVAGVTVGEVMTREVVSVGPEWPAESVASMLDRLRFRRLPVVDRLGRLIGIISRADLIKMLAAAPRPATEGRADAALAEEMAGRLAQQRWVAPGVSVEVTGGVIWIWGTVDSETERSAIETMARSIDGCRAVENHLRLRTQAPAYV